MFNINYDTTTGEIISYQGGADGSQNECPQGCDTLQLASEVPNFLGPNGAPAFRVDVQNKQLVLAQQPK